MDELLLASHIADLAGLSAAFGRSGERVVVPPCEGDVGDDDPAPRWSWTSADELTRWRDETGTGTPAERVIVAAWPYGTPTAVPLLDTSDDAFAIRVDRPLAVWLAALGAAVRRCADGGAIAAVVERPPPLDAAGWAPESGVADAVEAWARSLARSEGTRGVRVNVVTTPGRLVAPEIVDPQPSLSTFPGSVDHEVVEAVRMLVGPGVAGVTGTVVHADCGRSWR